MKRIIYGLKFIGLLALLALVISFGLAAIGVMMPDDTQHRFIP